MFHREPIMNTNNIVGKIGEDIAAAYLISQGYAIAYRNLRIGRDEIDIIARKEELYICIEIKSRLSTKAGVAEANLTHAKLKRLKRSAMAFSHTYNIPESRIRIEALALDIDFNKKLANIKHFLRIV